MRGAHARCAPLLEKHRQYTNAPPPVNDKSAAVSPRNRPRSGSSRRDPPGEKGRCLAVGKPFGALAWCLRKSSGMAGLTGLEPATSCVTGRISLFERAIDAHAAST